MTTRTLEQRGGRVVMQVAGDKGVHLQGQPGAGPGMEFRDSVWGFVRSHGTATAMTSRPDDHRTILAPTDRWGVRPARRPSIASATSERRNRR